MLFPAKYRIVVCLAAAALIISTLLATPGFGWGADARSNQLTPIPVSPRDTDPNIDNWLEPHQVYINTSAPRRNLLFVFLPGSFGKGNGQDLLQAQAAGSGFHALTLRYPNSWTVNSLCSADQDISCFEQVRLEILDGTDRTGKVTVSRANSIENRLLKLLQYLNKTRPGEGWDRYFEGEDVRWGAVVVAGHSQGGGHAAMIGHVHKVARVVMFASPNEYSTALRRLAPWLSGPHATPAGDFYGFAHTEDSLPAQTGAWQALGMAAFGPTVNVDNAQPPYANTRQLVTSAQTDNPHGSVAVDESVPLKPDGTPLFAEAWNYLCFNLGTAGPPPTATRTPAPATPTVDARVFSVAPTFSDYYAQYAGPKVLGPPIGPLLGTSQYFEKGRLEDHRKEYTGAWSFAYGLVVPELVAARSSSRVAGVSGPTYAELAPMLAPQARVQASSAGVATRGDGSVFVPYDPALQGRIGHVVPAYFWAYMNDAALFPGGWLHDIGLPLSETFNVIVTKGGEKRDVTMQLFERAALSFDPKNPPPFRVERANIGLSYRDTFPEKVLGPKP